MRAFIASALLVVAVGTVPAAAQVPGSSDSAIGVRVFGGVDLNSLAASKSFDAVVGTSTIAGFNAGADILSVWKNVFVRAAVSRMSKNGSRAFVFNGQAISLGIPVKLSMTPVEVGGGWRLDPVGSANYPVTPYGGGGVMFLQYSETASFAASGDDVSQTNQGFLVFGGAEVGVWKRFTAGAEVQYRGVPDAIGAAGVSQDFGETDLGGFTVRATFGFRP